MKTLEAPHAKQAGRTIRQGIDQAKAGEKGYWKAHLAISGLDEERREQLVTRLEEVTGHERAARVGDGNLHTYAFASGGLGGVMAEASNRLYSMLARDAGLDVSEIADSNISIALSPTSEAPEAPQVKGVKGVLGRVLGTRLANLSHGVSMAAAEALDKQEVARNGSKDYMVHLMFHGVSEEAVERLAERVEMSSAMRSLAEGGKFQVDVTCNNVASPLGALALAARKMESLINLMNRDVEVRAVAKPV